MSKRKNTNKSKIELIVVAIIVVVLAVWGYFENGSGDIQNSVVVGDGVIRAEFIDVGQGDSSLIRASSGENILIDGGDKGSGEVLEKYFANNSVQSLDAVIVSHYHADHAEGIYEIIGEIPIGTLYMPDVDYRPGLHDSLVKKADKNGVTIKYIKAGDKIVLDDNTIFDVLFPDESLYVNGKTKENVNVNNDSLLIKVSFGNSDFLFTGDLEADAEKTLTDYARLDCEVLKVGHHGSKTSTSEEFLNAVSPEYAVICLGKNNRYHHPHGQTMDRLESAGIEIYRTDLNGDIIITADANGIVGIDTEFAESN